MKLAWDTQRTKSQHDGGYVRETSAEPYHTARWTRLSRLWRMNHPLCEECKRKGMIVPATCVDHIVPYPVCKDFFDTSNLQSLCEACNIAKGNRDKQIIQAWRAQRG